MPLLPLVSERLWPRRDPAGAPVWVQGVSVGEVEIASTFIGELHVRRPDLRVLVTSTTPAGVALLSKRFDPAGGRFTIRPFPLDLPFSVRRFFDAAAPRLLVLVETELWPTTLTEAARRRVPVMLVNARLSERSARRYEKLAPLFRRALAALTRVEARSRTDADRFIAIGVPEDRVSVGGDIKFDRPAAEEPAFAAAFRQLQAGRPVLVAGSLADEEVPPVLEARRLLACSGLDVLLLLAPRRPESFGPIRERLLADGLSVVARSQLGTDASRPDVFLLDTLGELAAAYRLGTVAFVGGTLAPRGGHNVLESLAAGLPTLHGPSVWNISETLEAAAGAVFEVKGAGSLADRAGALLSDAGARARAAEASRALFARHSGAAARAAESALALLERGA